MAKDNIRVDVSLSIPRDQVESLIVSALEGGSNYWYCEAEWSHADEVEWYYEAPFRDGGYLRVKQRDDCGDVRPTEFDLTLERVVAALTKMSAEYPDHFSDIVRENADAVTGDVFLQLAVLDEMVY